MILIPREHSLLLVIDVQEHFYAPERDDIDRLALGRFVDRVAWITGVAAALGVPIVVTEEDPESNGATCEVVRRRLPDLAAVLPKPVFGAGDNPPIATAIRASSRGVIVACGLETDVCVTHSALTLQEQGYRVIAVRDALFSPGEAHEHGIARLLANGVELISAKGVFYDWTRTLADVIDFQAAHPELAHPPGFSL